MFSNVLPFSISGSYVGEGIKGLLKDGGTKRKEVVEHLIGSLVGDGIRAFFS
jgi:hypothetical protein